MGIERRREKGGDQWNHALCGATQRMINETKNICPNGSIKQGSITSTFCRFAGWSKDSSTDRLVPASAVSAWGPPVNLMLFGYTHKKGTREVLLVLDFGGQISDVRVQATTLYVDGTASNTCKFSESTTLARVGLAASIESD